MKKTKGALPSFAEIVGKTGHISSKTVNTNVFTSVRYGPDDAAPLPYVSARSMLAVPGLSMELMDYQGNAALSRYAKKLLGIDDVSSENIKKKSVSKLAAAAPTGPVKEKLLIPDCTPTDQEGLQHRALIGEQDEVNARLRQVLLPLSDGRYVSVTPLESSGLSALLRSRIRPLIDPDPDQKIQRWRKPLLASMPIGGSKPQNVGIRVRDMACLFVKTPTANFAVQSAIRAAFNGIRVLPAVTLLHEWRKSGQLAKVCAGLDNMTEKALFAESVQPLVRNLLERASVASIQVHGLLESQSADDREEAWAEIEARLGFVQSGFLKPEMRSPRWGERSAWAITNAIDNWLIRCAEKNLRTEPGDNPVLTASAKTLLVNTLVRELT